jgi:putative Mg2+ transporter-C (MgtC) family protein
VAEVRLAGCATAIYFVIVVGFPLLAGRLPISSTAISVIRVRYHDGRGVLRTVLGHTTAQGFLLAEVATEPVDTGPGSFCKWTRTRPHGGGTLQVHGRGPVNQLAAELSEVPGVETVVADDIHSASE